MRTCIKPPVIPVHEKLVKEEAGSCLNLVASLKNCARKKDLYEGARLHAHIRTCGLLAKNPCLGTTLISMYAKCGALSKAQEVFQELPMQNIFIWNALLAGYTQHGLGKEALDCFCQIQCEGLSPDAFTYACTLKACGITKNADLGKQLHDEIVSQGIMGKDVVLGNALVDMYAKCGLLAKAKEVLDELPVRNGVSWTALITGYAQMGQGKQAMACYDEMLGEGLSPNALTYACILKACGIAKLLDKGKRIHEDIANHGLLATNAVLGNALVDMYAKCGSLDRAREVLDELPFRDVVSWSALIAGYVQKGQNKEAMLCYEQMQDEGLSPDAMTYTCILKACGLAKEVNKGKQIHEEIVYQGLLGKDVVLGTSLVDMYAKCGVLARARQVLDELPVRNVVSWNALIAGYVQEEQCERATACYDQMRHEGLFPNAVTYTCILRVCGITKEVRKGIQLHGEIANQGLLGKDVMIGNALVEMYANSGVLTRARQALDELPVRDMVSWAALIAAYTQQGQGEEAIGCYEQMQDEGISPNVITYTCILKACGIAEDVDKGAKVHEEIASQGLLKKDVVLATALIEMYATCGVLTTARQVLDELHVRDTISWSTLIAAYTQHGQGEEAINCYEQMQCEGLCPNGITYSCILKACDIANQVDKGKQIHEEIASQGLLGKDVVLGNALVDMYAKCGALSKAQEVLEQLPVRDVASWTALIAGNAQQGQSKKVMVCYDQMRQEGLSPNMMTYACILKAYGLAKEIKKGKQIHEEIASQGLLEEHAVLGNALVYMYARCGELTRAQQLLDELPVRGVVSWSVLMVGYAQEGWAEATKDCFERMQSEGLFPNTVSWNTLIGAYAQGGKSEKALGCFWQMLCEGVSPDATTLVCVLNACSHSGLVDEGQTFFWNIEGSFGITPDVEHHACMVDLFGRAGHFDKAIAVIEKLPPSGHPTVWAALLGACRKWGNVKFGRLAFEHAVELGRCDAAAYVCMKNIYVAAGMLDKAQQVESRRVEIPLGSWEDRADGLMP